jgi:hypothetical protein
VTLVAACGNIAFLKDRVRLVRWVDNIRRDLGEVGWGDVDWIGLAKDRNRRELL